MIATHTQLCNYLFFGFQSGRNDCSQDCLRPICTINFLRDQSSDKLINFLDSQLDTRDSILETIEDRVSSLEARGTVNLLLSGTVNMLKKDQLSEIALMNRRQIFQVLLKMVAMETSHTLLRLLFKALIPLAPVVPTLWKPATPF